MPPVTRSTTRLSTDIYTRVNRPSPPEPTSYFPQFNRFPLDIRFMIWEATFEPRVVDLQIRPLRECHHILRHVRSDVAVPGLCGLEAPLDARLYTCSDFPEYDVLDEWIKERRTAEGREHPLLGFRSDCPTPPVLLACRESFTIASRSYTRSFSSLGSLPQTWFNFKLDTLYINRDTCHSADHLALDDLIWSLGSVAVSDELAKVERLAVKEQMLSQYGTPEVDLCRLLGIFGNVRKLSIVHIDFTITALKEGARKFFSGPKMLVEPVDFSRRAYMFENPQYHTNHNSEIVPAKVEYYKMLDKDFDEARDFKIFSSGRPFVRPVIDNKIILTPRVKAKFDAYQQAYEAVCSCRCYEEETVWLPHED